MKIPDDDQFLNDVQAAQLLGLSRGYMRKLRISGEGCRFSVFGRAVRYRRGDLLNWAGERQVASTSQQAPR